MRDDLPQLIADARAVLPDCTCPTDGSDDEGKCVPQCPHCAPALAILVLAEVLQGALRSAEKVTRFKGWRVRYEVRCLNGDWPETETEFLMALPEARRFVRDKRSKPGDFRNITLWRVYRALPKTEQPEPQGLTR